LYEELKDANEWNKIAKDMSPLYIVSPDDPPVFFIHGDADPTFPLQQSQAITIWLKETNIPYRLIIKNGGKHNGNDMNSEWQKFVDWFDKYLK
jgi:dipeptidyl aminopeptidase/acylaminoacyl peptidase